VFIDAFNYLLATVQLLLIKLPNVEFFFSLWTRSVHSTEKSSSSRTISHFRLCCTCSH